MKLLFWGSLALIVYAYLGYPALLSVLAKVRSRLPIKALIHPSVSIIMAAKNEECNLARKLDALRTFVYPSSQLEVIVASDGSTDSTPTILLSRGTDVVPVVLERSMGKAVALNAAVSRARNEILVFLDVRQQVDVLALQALVQNFADPLVGAVSGELLLENADGSPAGDALGIYWKIEKGIRKLESLTGSVVGVTGAIYAMRRELFVDLPPGLILDDVLAPMLVAKQKRRVVFEPEAIARDQIFQQRGKEFSRKVRTLTGNYQLLKLAPWLISPRNPILFRFVSHKLIRLLVPVFLITLFVSSALAKGAAYKGVLFIQMIAYVLATTGNFFPWTKRFKPVGIAVTFVMLNAAASVALYNFLSRKEEVWI